jgi:hypothetical protein
MECTLLSKIESLKAGAIPTNNTLAALRNAVNWNDDPSEISNQAGINKNARSVIIDGKRNFNVPSLSLNKY